MLRDFIYGLRQINRDRCLSASILLILAVGLGANTLVFSFLNALLLKQIPVRNPQNLFLLERSREEQVHTESDFSYRQYNACRQRSDLFLDVVAEQSLGLGSTFPVGEGNRDIRLVTTQIVSPNTFCH